MVGILAFHQGGVNSVQNPWADVAGGAQHRRLRKMQCRKLKRAPTSFRANRERTRQFRLLQIEPYAGRSYQPLLVPGTGLNARGGQGMHKDALNLPAPCYGWCFGRLKLSDGQVLLVVLWPSQAVDDQVLLVLLHPSPTA